MLVRRAESGAGSALGRSHSHSLTMGMGKGLVPRAHTHALGNQVQSQSPSQPPCPRGVDSQQQLGALARSRRVYPAHPRDYALEEEIGQGATATVWKALCLESRETVAIKSLDMEKCNSTLEEIRKEAQIMTMLSHPNLVRALSFFTKEHFLWVVMPYCDAGSCLHIMKAHHPDGLEEAVVASILRETLKALDYLHHHGLIHRDVKAGNILLDARGSVLLADFGVSACMFDTGDRQHSRKTFVGTPCWMAPEVLEHKNGYDFKADIWSFGITALELARGHAPFEKLTPMKVLMATLQGPTPGLDKEHEKRFSKAFKEMVAMCLVKDPSKRPSAEKLLKHPFFKQAKGSEFLVKQLLGGLPPLQERVKMLKAQEAAMLAAKQIPLTVQEEISQSEYQLAVSGWNFDLDELKRQAALLPQEEDPQPLAPHIIHPLSIPSIPEDHSVKYGFLYADWCSQQSPAVPTPGQHQPQSNQQVSAPAAEQEHRALAEIDEDGNEDLLRARSQSYPLPNVRQQCVPTSRALNISRSMRENRGRFQVTIGEDDEEDDNDFGSDEEEDKQNRQW